MAYDVYICELETTILVLRVFAYNKNITDGPKRPDPGKNPDPTKKSRIRPDPNSQLCPVHFFLAVF
jgi:hypothetical protein